MTKIVGKTLKITCGREMTSGLPEPVVVWKCGSMWTVPRDPDRGRLNRADGGLLPPEGMLRRASGQIDARRENELLAIRGAVGVGGAGLSNQGGPEAALEDSRSPGLGRGAGWFGVPHAG